MNTVEGVRQSTAGTYLASARNRANLTVRSHALVDRVVFEGQRATGIRLAAPDETIWADTVILAAGAYNSPMILMRSGLGPAEHLRALGVPVLQDMPGVGANLVDHPFVALRFAAPAAAYVEGRPGFQTLLTLKSDNALPSHDLHIFPYSIYRIDERLSEAQFSLSVAVIKPRSRGWLRLRSAAPDTPPEIDLGYFSDPRDLPRLLNGIEAARHIAQTAAMRKLALQEVVPGVEWPGARANLEDVVRAASQSYHHPVGTCRMGPASDDMAVVDTQGRVHGAEGLRVIDAAIMPNIPTANTNLPTIMIAERCANWLSH
jgi:choline dehydrogenase